MPTTPEVKSATVVLADPAPIGTPRLRSASVVIYQPPPVTPTLKSATAVVAPMVVATSPHLRNASVVPGRAPLRLLPVPHDWASPLIESLEASTDIMTAQNQDEQRSGNRSRCRRTLSLSFRASAEELPHVEALLYAIQGQAMEVPIWTDAALLEDPVAIGADEIEVETSTRDYGAGGRIMLMEPDYAAGAAGVRDTFYEVLDIDSLVSGGVALSGTTKRAWPVGTRVAPVRPCVVSASYQWTRESALGGSFSLDAELTEQGYPNLPAHSADLYRDRPVWSWRADRNQDITETMSRLLTRITSVGGTISSVPRRDRPAITREHLYRVDTRAEILQLRSLLEFIGGRRLQFWLCSHMRDLELARPSLATDSHITVRSVRGFDWYHHAHGPYTEQDTIGYHNAGRRDIEIRATPASSPIRRRIMGWSRVGDGLEQVQLSEALGVSLPTPGVPVVSWLVPVRMESDRIDLRWLTDGVVETELRTRSL